MGAAAGAGCPAQVLTVLTEGSSPARAAGTGPADVVTGSPVVTLTLVPAAQPKPSLRALWQAEAQQTEEPVLSRRPREATLRLCMGTTVSGFFIMTSGLYPTPYRCVPMSPNHPQDRMGLPAWQGMATEPRSTAREICTPSPFTPFAGRRLPAACPMSFSWKTNLHPLSRLRRAGHPRAALTPLAAAAGVASLTGALTRHRAAAPVAVAAVAGVSAVGAPAPSVAG